MSELDFKKNFYSGKYDLASIQKAVDVVLGTDSENCSVIVFSTQKNVKEWFVRLSNDTRQIHFLDSSKDILLFEMIYKHKERSETVREKGKFFIIKHPSYETIHLAITIEKSHFVRDGLRTFIRKLYPDIVMPFISNSQFQKMLEPLQDSFQARTIKIYRTSQSFRFENMDKHEKTIKAVSWQNLDIKEAFDWIYQNNGWFKSLNFEIKSNFLTTDVSVSRHGYIRTNKLFEKTFEGIIEPISKILDEKVRLLKKEVGYRIETTYLSPWLLILTKTCFATQKKTLNLLNL